MARLFERVAVVGVGLIGGSLALAARREGLFGDVIGVGRGAENLRVAHEHGIVDRTTTDVNAVGAVDLVVLATPVRATPALARALSPRLAPGCVVSDVGSVKDFVVRELESLLSPDRPFVGAHPIAGAERSGAAFADPELFRGARCIVTPTERTDATALQRIEALWRGVGARVERMSPPDHDRALAWTSHVVHALSYTLARAIDATDPAYFGLGGPSLQDVTRIASSPPEMWRDIFLSNSAAVLSCIDIFRRHLEELRSAIAGNDEQAIERLLEEGRAARRRLESIG